MSQSVPSSEARRIVVIGGGAVGVSSAYFLTHHAHFDSKIHSVTIIEANDIAGGSSGKSGGLLASWATPKCLAPLSFRTHADLARKHDGDKLWGYRPVHAAEVELEAQNVVGTQAINGENFAGPKALNWLLPNVLKAYKEIGTPANTAQINSYLYTTNIANLVQDAGATIIYGRASSVNYDRDQESVQSVTYRTASEDAENVIEATDVIVAAGPWTPNLLSRVKLFTPRGHSVIVKPSSNLSNHVLFPTISAAPDANHSNVISPEIYPRPPDSKYDFDTVYASGPDDYSVSLPSSTGDVKVDPTRVEDVWSALRAVSGPIRDGEVLVRQACYKPQIRQHEEDEEVGPMVGRYDQDRMRGLWVATGHDEWGMQNSAGTGLLISEMVWEGRAKSADATFLEPSDWMSK